MSRLRKDRDASDRPEWAELGVWIEEDENLTVQERPAGAPEPVLPGQQIRDCFASNVWLEEPEDLTPHPVSEKQLASETPQGMLAGSNVWLEEEEHFPVNQQPGNTP
jgi:hypothetical protein